MADTGSELPSVSLLGMKLAAITGDKLLDFIFGSLSSGKGGWVVTANLDFMRRFVHDRLVRALYAAADIRVADGMPLIWASRLQGEALPERIAGSSLVWQIAQRAAQEGKSIYLLGGDERARIKAAEVWKQRYSELRIAGESGPMISNPPSADQLSSICRDLFAANPDIVLCGFGSPKQEYVLQAVRAQFTRTWLLGVGVSFSFVAGDIARAPRWMQENGLEWLFRLSQEPSRLARRYLVEGLPFALELFSRALLSRLRSQRR